MEKEYKYDVAISFAEEDRNAALALALALEMEGLKKVYYYPKRYEETWGENLEEKLKQIYSEEAKYAIIIVSKKYFEKRYSKVELSAILIRMHNENSIYALPVVLEPNVIEDSSEFADLGYLNWEFDPKTIAMAAVKLLGDRGELKYSKVGTVIKSIEGSIIKGDSVDVDISGDILTSGGVQNSIKDSIIQAGKININIK